MRIGLEVRLAAESRRHPRAVGLEERFAGLLPEVLIGIGLDQFAVLAARALAPRPEPEVTLHHIHAPAVSVREQAGAASYVGGHPMAGSERSGPLAASASLFDGRPWAITPHPESDPEAVEVVEDLVRLCGAVPVWLTPQEHDRAVARTSHVPHLLSVLAAARLAAGPENHLALSGQGVRDVTRVAAGDPRLYSQIVGANADAVLDLLGEVREQLDAVIAAVGAGDRSALEDVLASGVAGTRVIPAKHGGPARPMRSVWVSVPDHPGELARLLADAVASEVNVEDIRIDHDPGRPVGLVELVVEDTRADHLLGSLESRGWETHR